MIPKYIFFIFQMRFLLSTFIWTTFVCQDNLFRLDNFGFDTTKQGETSVTLDGFDGFKEGRVSMHFFFFLSRMFYTQLPYSIHKEVANNRAVRNNAEEKFKRGRIWENVEVVKNDYTLPRLPYSINIQTRYMYEWIVLSRRVRTQEETRQVVRKSIPSSG